MKRVLITESIDPKVVAAKLSDYEIVVRLKMTDQQILEEVALADAVVVRSATKMTNTLIEAGKKLKVIGRAGVGYDNIDIKTATERGVVVVTAPDANVISAAEHTLALMFAAAKSLKGIFRQVDGWEGESWKRLNGGTELFNKTLGIIGLGKVGSIVAEVAKSLGMKIVAVDPFVHESRAKQLGVVLVDLETLLRQADFLSIHLILNDATKKMIGKTQLALLKDSAVLINTSRGAVLDEEALLEVLNQDNNLVAALDVLSEEPPKDSILFKLLHHPKVLYSPHVAASTPEAQERVAASVRRYCSSIGRRFTAVFSKYANL